MENEFKPVELNLDTDELAEAWAKYTVMHLQEAMGRYDLSANGPLYRSIEMELVRNGGNIQKALHRFLQYGRFVDMGVGRGVAIGAAGSGAFSASRNSDGTLKQYRRKAKKWFSKSYYADVQRFKELYAQKFARTIPVQIADAMTVSVRAAV